MKKILSLLAVFFLLSSANICNRYEAVVESVYDGDTITCDVVLGFDVTLSNQKIRLYGIDAPEVRGVERPDGLIARDALRDLITGETLELVDHGKGKYGRLIGELYLDTINVSDWMVRNGYAEYRDY